MATGEDETPNFPESLMCPMCLDVFEDATMLLCGHTFCRKCLKLHDASSLDRNHLVCPLCRRNTQLQENRVDGLPTNVTVNGLVDDYRMNGGGPFASTGVRTVKCTMCAVKGVAVFYCKECNHYMCDECHNGHKRMSAVFASHQVLPTSAGAISTPAQVQKQIPNRPTMKFNRTVDLQGRMCGMTAVSEDAVVISYCPEKGAEKVDSRGNKSQYLSQDASYIDLAHQNHSGNAVIARDNETDKLMLEIYSQNGSYLRSKNVSGFPRISRCTSNCNDEIILANRKDCIVIYDSSISTPLCRVKTKDRPHQAFETRSGAIISSTCCYNNPNKVTAYGRNGRAGGTLKADHGEYLYAAVDSEGRVYIANVNRAAGKAVITQYKMDGLKFRKVFQFEKLNLTLGDRWCYMVSLSCDMLAFACDYKLYFIEIHPS